MLRETNKQSGIALLTAILIVAIVSASATYLIDSGYTVLRKAQQRIDNEQILHLSKAVESYAINILYRDNYFDFFTSSNITTTSASFDEEPNNPLGYDPFNDSLYESWSKPEIPEFIEPLLADEYLHQDILYITDLNRYFNVNNLHFSNATDEAKTAFNNSVKILKYLMKEILEPDIDIDKLANDIIDWVDHDKDSRSEILFSEDDMYRRSDSIFRPANRPISSIGELKHVLNMTPEILDKLSEFIVALPVYVINQAPYKRAFSPAKQGATGRTALDKPVLTLINVNTCSPELLKSLFAIYGIEGVSDLALSNQGEFQRKTAGQTKGLDFFSFYTDNFRTNNNVANDPNYAQIVEGGIKSVASEFSQFFLIESFLQKSNGLSLNIESIVYQDNSEYESWPVVIRRQFDWLPFADLTKTDEDEDDG